MHPTTYDYLSVLSKCKGDVAAQLIKECPPRVIPDICKRCHHILKSKSACSRLVGGGGGGKTVKALRKLDSCNAWKSGQSVQRARKILANQRGGLLGLAAGLALPLVAMGRYLYKNM